MKVKSGCFVLVLMALGAEANDSVNSELSHVIGGAAMGAGFTAIADHYGYRENRAWIGFGISTGIGIVGEFFPGNSGFSLLDASANALGAAIGAYGTSEWILTPVISPDAGYVGLSFHYNFN